MHKKKNIFIFVNFKLFTRGVNGYIVFVGKYVTGRTGSHNLEELFDYIKKWYLCYICISFSWNFKILGQSLSFTKNVWFSNTLGFNFLDHPNVYAWRTQ